MRISFNLIKKKLFLKNENISLITNNCLGGILLKDYGMRFNSPFVNLYLEDEDYIELLKNLRYYMSQEIVEFKCSKDYPIGLLKNLKIHFLHYKSFKEAKECWERRKERIKWDNLFVVWTCINERNIKLEEDFEALALDKKIFFTNLKLKNYKSSYYIKGFEEKVGVGYMWSNCNICRRKYYDQFDWINWFNS